MGCRGRSDHIEYIGRVAGRDCVGLGSDFDGISETPSGLDGVDKYPALLVELAHRGWTYDDLVKVSGGNLLRVMREVESVSQRLRQTTPAAGVTLDIDKQ